MEKIYFIIVTYNAMKWAEKCFSSLQKSSISVKTIVVDNGSTDGTQEYIKTNFPEVNFIQSPENLGFGKANNIGIEIAYKEGADFFYLMNQDAWIFEDTVENLLKIIRELPDKNEIGILSPMHLDGSEERLDVFLDKYIATNFENRMISDLYLNSTKPYYQISFVNAAHWMIPKETIEIVGGFNPFFFHYGEDNEYVNRLHFHGKKLILVTNSKAVHDGKQDLKKVDYNKFQDLSLETRILNPQKKNELKNIKNSLIQSIFKNLALGNFKSAKKSYSIYNRIVSQEKTLNLNKKIISSNPHPFLNI